MVLGWASESESDSALASGLVLESALVLALEPASALVSVWAKESVKESDLERDLWHRTGGP